VKKLQRFTFKRCAFYTAAACTATKRTTGDARSTNDQADHGFARWSACDLIIRLFLCCLRLRRRYQRRLLVRLQFIAEHKDVWRGLDAQTDFVARDANDGQNYGIA